MTESLVAMREIRKSFAGNEVLHGVDFEVTAGTVHGLVGHNGAGKSTLIKVLAGFYSNYTGVVELSGNPIELRSPQSALDAGIAVIYQEFALIPDFDVAANLALGHETHSRGRIDKKAMRKDAETLLEELGFDIPLDIPVSRLSVAHQQLTEIAKALSRNAKVLVMDEPTARLAPAEREALFEVMRRLTSRGVGLIFISHFLEEVLRVSDVVTVLRDGNNIVTRPAVELSLTELSTAIVGERASHVTEQQLRNTITDEVILEVNEFASVGRPTSSFVVHRGEILGLAGLVGSGRTSLVEAICGAKAHVGSLSLLGEPTNFSSPAEAAQAGVVLVPEDRKNRGLVMTSSVAENITLTALAKRFTTAGFIKADAQQAAVRQATQRFNIRGTNAGKAQAESLSGGNQQKLLIARVAIADPKVLILDQPTAGVDIGAKDEIYGHIRELVDSGTACLVVSDELEELLTLCDNVAVVRAGRVAETYQVEQLNPGLLLELMSKSEDLR